MNRNDVSIKMTELRLSLINSGQAAEALGKAASDLEIRLSNKPYGLGGLLLRLEGWYNLHNPSALEAMRQPDSESSDARPGGQGGE